MNMLDSFFKNFNMDSVISYKFSVKEENNLELKQFSRDKLDYIYIEKKEIVLTYKDIFLISESVENINDFSKNSISIDIDEFDKLEKVNLEYPFVVIKRNNKIYGIVNMANYKNHFNLFSHEFKIIFKNILNVSHDAICIVDKYKTVIFWNKKAEKIYNIPEDKILGKHIADVFPKALLPHVVDNEKSYEDVFNNPREDYKNIITAKPIYFNGEMVGAISCDKDISENDKNKVVGYSKNKGISKNIYTNTFDDITGEDGRFREIVEFAKKMSDSNINILITGESGTGKELFAQAIHNESKRDGEFVPVNCAAIPKDLLESELFGYEKGSFTGALSEGKLGKFERANNGTILLDEIGDLPLSMQPKILRILEDGILYRIGGSAPIKVDVRVIASTNNDLKNLIDKKMFRKDLYYRLNSVHIELPPLRERKKDIGILIDKFLREYSIVYRVNHFSLNEDLIESLVDYKWEGNIRELKNVIERYVIMKKNGLGNLEFPAFVAYDDMIAFNENLDLTKIITKVEKDTIIKALKKSENNKAKAAKLLKIPRTTLIYKIDKYGIMSDN